MPASQGESEFDETVISQVRDFIDGDDHKLGIMEQIVEYEEDNPKPEGSFIDYDGVRDSYWILGSDVSMKPAYMGIVKNSGFTNVVFSSNSSTILCLKDRESTREAIDREIEEPDEGSDEWIAKRVKDEALTLDDIFNSVEVTEDEAERIHDIIENNDCLEYWSEYIVPGLKQRPTAKKAILIMLASPDDKHGNKGRVNVKIYGPPGTGKSTIKNFLRDTFNANTIDGPRASEADLTYNKTSGELGTLPLSHNGIIVVEEADEMGTKSIGSTLTSFGESGQLDIRNMNIPAKVRGVMLSNFESKRQIIREWSPESLNRFDFVLKFELLDDEARDDTLDDLYMNFRKPSPDVGVDLLKKYLKIVREFNPELSELDEIIEFKKQHISDIQNIREGLSVMNIAWTIARLNLEDVKLSHYKTAWELTMSEQKSLKDKFS